MNDIPSTLSDEGIKAIAEKDGVIGIHFASRWVNATADQATVDDLVQHIDYIAELVGVDYVGLGPDFGELELLGMDAHDYYTHSLAHPHPQLLFAHCVENLPTDRSCTAGRIG